MYPVMNFIGNIGYVCVAILGGYLAANGRITVGNIQSFIQYNKQFTQPIVQIAQVSSMLQSMVAAAERIFEFLEEEEEIQKVENPVSIEGIKGNVEFDHVHFGYNENKIIINDFNAKIKEGQKIAIVGPTGAGKTTITDYIRNTLRHTNLYRLSGVSDSTITGLEKSTKMYYDLLEYIEKMENLSINLLFDRTFFSEENYCRLGKKDYSFTEENEKFSKEISDIRGALEKGEDVSKKISDFRQIAIHYAKKGDLIYPLLKVRYEISGPSDVMWTVDDEIRDELAAIDKESNHDEEWINRVQAVLTRADEMIYKENNILFPICAVNFTVEEWYGIYEDAKDYALVYGIENRWEEAEKYVQDKKNRHKAAINEGEIVMGGGHMSVAQLEAMLNTLPIEITFIDDNNINRFFNEGAKVFKRPGMAIDREVFSCHPPKIEPMVRSIIESFKNHTRDSVPVWMEKQGKPFLVTYYAVRDKKGIYLGTVEVVQDMQFAKEHFTSI